MRFPRHVLLDMLCKMCAGREIRVNYASPSLWVPYEPGSLLLDPSLGPDPTGEFVECDILRGTELFSVEVKLKVTLSLAIYFIRHEWGNTESENGAGAACSSSVGWEEPLLLQPAENRAGGLELRLPSQIPSFGLNQNKNTPNRSPWGGITEWQGKEFASA